MTWYEYIQSLTIEELADFLAHYRCNNCVRRMNNCFPGDTEEWLRKTIDGKERE